MVTAKAMTAAIGRGPAAASREIRNKCNGVDGSSSKSPLKNGCLSVGRCFVHIQVFDIARRKAFAAVKRNGDVDDSLFVWRSFAEDPILAYAEDFGRRCISKQNSHLAGRVALKIFAADQNKLLSGGDTDGRLNLIQRWVEYRKQVGIDFTRLYLWLLKVYAMLNLRGDLSFYRRRLDFFPSSPWSWRTLSDLVGSLYDWKLSVAYFCLLFVLTGAAESLLLKPLVVMVWNPAESRVATRTLAPKTRENLRKRRPPFM